MPVPLYIACGVVLVLCALVVVRRREGTWFTPGCLMLCIYFVNFFLDPPLRYLGFHGRYPTEVWSEVTMFNIAAYVMLLLGYMLPRRRLAADKQVYRDSQPKPMFNNMSFGIAALMCFAVMVVAFTAMIIYDRFGAVRFVFEDNKPQGYEYIVSFYGLLLTFIPALFVAAYLDRYRKPSGVHAMIVWGLVIAVGAYALALFDRGMIFSVMFSIALIYHFRYKGFSRRHLFLVLLMGLFVVGFTLLRRTGTGVTNISWASLVALMEEGSLAVQDVAIIGIIMFEGQGVLPEVIQLVEEYGFFYGRTYLNTLMQHLIPFYGSDIPVPAQWYRMVAGHAPNTYGRGFGISPESYLNFGHYGVVLFFFVGLLLRWLSYKMYTTQHPIMLVWVAYALGSFLQGLRGDSYALFARALLHIVPLVLIWILGTKFTRSIGHSSPSPMRRRNASDSPEESLPPSAAVGQAAAGDD